MLIKARKDWIAESLWRQVKRHIPIPCVDVILENPRGEVLLGWREILPYKDVWALPGGRLFKGEKLVAAVKRILSQYSLSAGSLFLVGVFPIKFPSRSDVSICLASKQVKGDPRPDGYEFSRFRWADKLPPRLGANYRRMILRWRYIQDHSEVMQYISL